MTTGVLVMAYGTPSTPDVVEAYYTRIRHGRPPTLELLADLQRRYNAIGGTSPLAERTADQVAGIAAALDRTAPGEFDVRFGSKYEPPLLEDAARSFSNDGFTSVIGLVLAPHSSSMSTDQYMTRAKEALGDGVHFTAIGAWWEFPGFLELIAARVLDALSCIPLERRATTEVIFSAHSLPEKILAQSAGRTADPWIGPDILTVLRTKRAEGLTDIVSCPIGFVADHLEVLFDIDIEAQGVAREIDLNVVRTTSLNADPAFVELLARVVRAAAS
jgi:ferrochelatase